MFGIRPARQERSFGGGLPGLIMGQIPSKNYGGRCCCVLADIGQIAVETPAKAHGWLPAARTRGGDSSRDYCAAPGNGSGWASVNTGRCRQGKIRNHRTGTGITLRPMSGVLFLQQPVKPFASQPGHDHVSRTR